MLQLKQISQVLSQALQPIETQSQDQSHPQSQSQSQIQSHSQTSTQTQPLISSSSSSSSLSYLSTTPISLSLLAYNGLPLTSVNISNLNEINNLSVDNLKIYSLLALNFFNQQQLQFQEINGNGSNDPLNHWCALELDENLRVIIQKLKLNKDNDDEDSEIGGKEITNNGNMNDGEINSNKNNEDNLFVVIFYDAKLSNSVAKLKLDNVCHALEDGLQGFTRI